MAEKGKIYYCKECDNIVKVVEAGAGIMMCCDTPMKVQEEKKATSADHMQSWGGDFKGRTLQ